MSWQGTSWVTEKSQHKGSRLLALLMLANHCNPEGQESFPSIHTLARECRMSPRAVRYIIRGLVKSGELMCEANAGPRGCNVYRIPGVVRDGFHLRGTRPARKAPAAPEDEAKFAPSGDLPAPQTGSRGEARFAPRADSPVAPVGQSGARRG